MATRRCPTPVWLNNTINIDTGCVFGGQADRAALAGARTGERARAPDLCRAGAPVWPKRRAQSGDDTLLRIEDALGKQIIRRG